MGTGSAARTLSAARLDPRRALSLLLGACGVVLALHLVTGVMQTTDADWAEALYRIFNVNNEGNVPTLFAGALWLLAAAVAWQLARTVDGDGRSRRGWLGILVVCLLIAADESFALHERLIEPVREATGADGILFFAWVIPYALLALLVGLVLAPFVVRLERPVNLLVLLAGAIFVTGALGMELAEGAIAADLAPEDRGTSTYIALYTIEETLELLGVTIFIYALLRQLQRGRGEAHDSLSRADDPGPEPAAG